MSGSEIIEYVLDRDDILRELNQISAWARAASKICKHDTPEAFVISQVGQKINALWFDMHKTEDKEEPCSATKTQHSATIQAVQTSVEEN